MDGMVRLNALVRMLERAISFGSRACSHKNSCNALVRMFEIMDSLLEIMLGGQVPGVSTSPPTLARLENVVSKGKGLLLDCQSRSRMYMILRSEDVIRRFGAVALDLASCVEAFPLEEFGPYASEVEQLRTLLTRTMFVMDPVEKLIASVLQKALLEHPSGGLNRETLNSLLSLLDWHDVHDMAKEKMRLEDDRVDAGADDKQEEAAKIGELLDLISLMQASWEGAKALEGEQGQGEGEGSQTVRIGNGNAKLCVSPSEAARNDPEESRKNQVDARVLDEPGRVHVRSSSVSLSHSQNGHAPPQLFPVGGGGSSGTQSVVHQRSVSAMPVIGPMTPTRRTPPGGRPVYPSDFLCPLSLELMAEPVILCSGVTYERPYIQLWLDRGKRTCPKTKKLLLNTNLIPNKAVEGAIAIWCEENMVPLPRRKSLEQMGFSRFDEMEATHSGATSTTTDSVSAASSYQTDSLPHILQQQQHFLFNSADEPFSPVSPATALRLGHSPRQHGAMTPQHHHMPAMQQVLLQPPPGRNALLPRPPPISGRAMVLPKHNQLAAESVEKGPMQSGRRNSFDSAAAPSLMAVVAQSQSPSFDERFSRTVDHPLMGARGGAYPSCHVPTRKSFDGSFESGGGSGSGLGSSRAGAMEGREDEANGLSPPMEVPMSHLRSSRGWDSARGLGFPSPRQQFGMPGGGLAHVDVAGRDNHERGRGGVESSSRELVPGEWPSAASTSSGGLQFPSPSSGELAVHSSPLAQSVPGGVGPPGHLMEEYSDPGEYSDELVDFAAPPPRWNNGRSYLGMSPSASPYNYNNSNNNSALIEGAQDDFSASSRLSEEARADLNLHVISGRQLSAPYSHTSLPASSTNTLVSQGELNVLMALLRSTSVQEQREGARQTRLFTKSNASNRGPVAAAGAIPPLVALLSSEDADVVTNAVTALLNLSIDEKNKALIMDAGVVEPLVRVVTEGSSDARENAAATIFSLTVVDKFKCVIGEANAIPPLVDLLVNGTERGKKDAATALFNLSIFNGNKRRLVDADAIIHLVNMISTDMADKAVAVLANLSTVPEGRHAIVEADGISQLVPMLDYGSARGKENAAAALLQLACNSSEHLQLIINEGANIPLSVLQQSGTPRAKEKARALLRYLKEHRSSMAGNNNA